MVVVVVVVVVDVVVVRLVGGWGWDLYCVALWYC